MERWVWVAVVLGGWAAATALLTIAQRACAAKKHPLATTAVAARNVLAPLAAGVLLLKHVFEEDSDGILFKVLLTCTGIAAIHVLLSFVRNTALVRTEGGQETHRVPKLLIDILRLILVLVGAAVVVSSVWEVKLGGLLTAIGVSSIVLGLALQNTLDNVMAGIAVLLEGPFHVGDWIEVSGVTGEVVEMNWRSVRVRTRDRDLVTVPNSVIGKEMLTNFSKPNRTHGERLKLGFSYDDPPNKVKRVLQGVALKTRGILAQPTPEVRVNNYGDFTIDYEVKFFIEDFARQPQVLEEFMTMVWYAAKRSGLTIPFPIQTAYEYHADLPEKPDLHKSFCDSLGSVPVFVPLSPEELDSVSREAIREDYGRGERVVNQGDKGESFFLIQEGTAVVSVRDDAGGEREVARLGRGEFFGEMSALTGEPRAANVSAFDDLVVLIVHKRAFQRMLTARPSLAQEMAEIVEARRHGLKAIRDMKAAPENQRASIRRGTDDLVGRIKRFLGV